MSTIICVPVFIDAADLVTLRPWATRKGGAAASNPRLTSLRAAIDTLNARVQALETLMKQVFNGVFVQRYRDIDEHIRIECVQAVGRW